MRCRAVILHKLYTIRISGFKKCTPNIVSFLHDLIYKALVQHLRTKKKSFIWKLTSKRATKQDETELWQIRDHLCCYSVGILSPTKPEVGIGHTGRGGWGDLGDFILFMGERAGVMRIGQWWWWHLFFGRFDYNSLKPQKVGKLKF